VGKILKSSRGLGPPWSWSLNIKNKKKKKQKQKLKKTTTYKNTKKEQK
jgi:hypothetical protein